MTDGKNKCAVRYLKPKSAMRVKTAKTLAHDNCFFRTNALNQSRSEVTVLIVCCNSGVLNQRTLNTHSFIWRKTGLDRLPLATAIFPHPLSLFSLLRCLPPACTDDRSESRVTRHMASADHTRSYMATCTLADYSTVNPSPPTPTRARLSAGHLQ